MLGAPASCRFRRYLRLPSPLMEAPEFVRVCLAHHREQGLPFMQAWSRTLHAMPRGSNESVATQRAEWVEILKWSRPAWQAAYDGCAVELVLAPELGAVLLLRPARPVRLAEPLAAAA